MTEKAFNNFRHNGIHLNFPNGNQVSTIWGSGSYSENYDIWQPKDFGTFMESETAEIMVTCSPKLLKKLAKKFNNDSGGVFGYLSITDWIYIVNLVAKENK